MGRHSRDHSSFLDNSHLLCAHREAISGFCSLNSDKEHICSTLRGLSQSASNHSPCSSWDYLERVTTSFPNFPHSPSTHRGRYDWPSWGNSDVGALPVSCISHRRHNSGTKCTWTSSQWSESTCNLHKSSYECDGHSRKYVLQLWSP